MTRPTILRIPNPEHTRRVLETRKALRLVPPGEGVWLALPERKAA